MGIKDFFIKNVNHITNGLILALSIPANLLSNLIYDTLTKNNIIPINTMYSIIIWIIFLITLFIIFYLINNLIKNKWLSEISEKEHLNYAFQLVKRVSSTEQGYLLDLTDFSLNELASLSFKKLQNLVEACYQLFESEYSSSESEVNGINFEVTFMTKSYIDNEITIPAFCNKERRSPTSMQLRNINKTIYNNTITAGIYREAETSKPSIHIVENTKKDDNYNELYPKQKERIKSSIIFPVLSPVNLLMGTIVVHCDKASFFQKKKERYWREILEIFSVQIGKEKIILDIVNNHLQNKSF